MVILPLISNSFFFLLSFLTTTEDNIKGGIVTDIGNWAYLLGGLLLGYGLYILYYVIYKQNNKSKESVDVD